MTILNLPKHIKPELLRDDRVSTAPYNFVPLPDKVVVAVNDPEELPSHDTYDNPNYPHTGYFDVTLTTKSPLYVRGMLTRMEFDLDEEKRDRHGRPVQNGVTRTEDRLKNKPDFFHTGDAAKPVIPGSSLRGMLRSLVEIVSYGKVSRVSDKKLIYRAVGDTTALGAWYREQTLGGNQDTYPNMQFDYPSPQLKGGYLGKHQGQWAIRPAVEHLGESFVHVEYSAAHRVIGGQGRHEVYVKPVGRIPSNRGRRGPGILTLDLAVTTGISSGSATKPAGMEKAALVESGNAPRKHMHCAIYEPNNSVPPIPIPSELWQTYEEDRELTRGIRTRKVENPGDPLFYLTDGAGKLIFFGPTMMFRLPYNRSVWSMIPKELRSPLAVDLADAMFGFVREKRDFPKEHSLSSQGKKARAYATRVRISDAELAGDYEPNQLWLMGNAQNALTPEILSTPKPTSFQHYLVQEDQEKADLSHYDSPRQNAEGETKGHRTYIRGAKRYWMQGSKTATQLRAPNTTPATSTQHTLIKPVRANVKFTFRVHFENLSNEELGALCWAMRPLGDEQKTYCHQLGMGKALGMGAVTLEATLRLNKRKDRYTALFAGNNWATGYENEELAAGGERLKGFTDAFEAEVLKQLDNPCQRLAELKRIAMLLKMMEWENGLSPAELLTQKIEKGGGFAERLVLPDPSFWIEQLERDRLVEPTPTQQPDNSEAEQPGTGGNAQPQSPTKAPLSGIGNTLAVTTQLPTKAIAKPQSAKEKVTLIGNVKNGKARVKTEEGEEINCEKMNPFDGHKTGSVIWAKVERGSNGKAISAKYIL